MAGRDRGFGPVKILLGEPYCGVGPGHSLRGQLMKRDGVGILHTIVEEPLKRHRAVLRRQLLAGRFGQGASSRRVRMLTLYEALGHHGGPSHAEPAPPKHLAPAQNWRCREYSGLAE